MKKILLKYSLPFLAVIAVTVAAVVQWQRFQTRRYEYRYRENLWEAQEQGKFLLVVCSGTDWCPPCRRLQQEVLMSPEFTAFAEQHLKLLPLHFAPPDRKEKEEADNEELYRRLLPGQKRSLPALLLCDPETRLVIAELHGFTPCETVIRTLSEAIQQKQKGK